MQTSCFLGSIILLYVLCLRVQFLASLARHLGKDGKDSGGRMMRSWAWPVAPKHEKAVREVVEMVKISCPMEDQGNQIRCTIGFISSQRPFMQFSIDIYHWGKEIFT